MEVRLAAMRCLVGFVLGAFVRIVDQAPGVRSWLSQRSCRTQGAGRIEFKN